MNTILLLIFILLVVAVVVMLVVVVQKLRRLEGNGEQGQQMTMLHQSIQGMQQQLSRTHETMGTRLDSAARMFGAVSKELGQLQEMGTHMRDLQDFLRSPKLRGNIGEMVLRDLLEQYFSREQFKIQYKFKEGQIVDAIIKTDQGLIPIDSKFPMETFLRMLKTEDEEQRATLKHDFIKDIKKHITDISKKYVLPGEGTVDFALMYVPNESVYYELIRSEEDLNHYAYQKKVFPVSPNSFYYFMRVIMMGMEGRRLEASTQQIIKTLLEIQQDAEKFSDEMNVLNTHINNTRTAYDRTLSRFTRLVGKIENVKLLNPPDSGKKE